MGDTSGTPRQVSVLLFSDLNNLFDHDLRKIKVKVRFSFLRRLDLKFSADNDFDDDDADRVEEGTIGKCYASQCGGEGISMD